MKTDELSKPGIKVTEPQSSDIYKSDFKTPPIQHG